MTHWDHYIVEMGDHNEEEIENCLSTLTPDESAEYRLAVSSYWNITDPEIRGQYLNKILDIQTRMISNIM